MEKAIEDFRALCVEAEKADSADIRIEPYLMRILKLVTSFPSLRDEFANEFIRIVNGEIRVPWELLPFCMHSLRWDEVRRAIVVRLDSRPDWRAVNVLSHYLESFDDDWEDVNLFEYYSKKPGEKP